MLRKDKSTIPVEAILAKTPDGFTQGIVRDITERKKNEEERRLSEELFSNAFHASPAGIVITRISDGKIIDANESFLKMFEFNRDEAIGHNSIELNIFTPEERAKIIQQQIASGGLQNFEFTSWTKSGIPINLLSSSKPMEIRGELCHITTMIDITERKHVSEELRKSEERLRLSTELANVAVWEYDFISNSMSRSSNHDQLYELEWQEKWDINTFLNATHPDDREYSNSIIQKSVAVGGPDNYKFDFRVVYPDQSIHWLNVTGQVVERNTEGQGIIVRGTLIPLCLY